MELDKCERVATEIEKQIDSIVPTKATPEVMAHFVDMVLLDGLKNMHNIIASGDKDASRVAAFNGVINLGKFMEERIQTAIAKENDMEIDI